MTNNPDALPPSAKEVMQQIALAEAEEAKKQARAQTEAEAEKKALIDQLRKPEGASDEEAIRRGLEIIDWVIKNWATEVEIIRFLNERARTKAARSISRSRAGRYAHRGTPKQNYQFWDKSFRLCGYKLRVQMWTFRAVCLVTFGMTVSWS